MRLYHLFLSLVSLFFALFLVGLGIFIGMIPHAPHFGQKLANLFLGQSPLLYILGSGMVCVGAFLLIAFAAMNKKRVLHLKMGSHPADVELPVVQKLLSRCWKRFFPKADVATDVMLRRGRLYIAATLPKTPFLEQKALLEDVEKELQALFERTLGYRREFVLQVSFEN